MANDHDIDTYVDSLYNGLDDLRDAAELKEEMRSHLVEVARHLREEGHSEEDSVRLAIERFGDEASVRQGLSSLYEPSGGGQPRGQAPTEDGTVRKGISALIYAILAVFIPIIGLGFAVAGIWIAARNLRRPSAATISPIVSGFAVAIAIVGLLMQVFYILGVGMFALSTSYVHTSTSASASGSFGSTQVVTNQVGGPGNNSNAAGSGGS